MNTFRFLVAAVCLVALSVAARPLIAQASGARIRVALVDTLSTPTARAELLRFSDVRQTDVILLRRGDARPDDLLAALRMHRRLEGRRPTRPGVVSRATVTGYEVAATVPRTERAAATRMLEEVQRAPASRIGDFGRGRWSEFALRR